MVAERDCIVADRNFCTMGFLFGVARRKAFFVIRQHGSNVVGQVQGPQRMVGRDAGLRLPIARLQQEHRVIANAGEALLSRLDDVAAEAVVDGVRLARFETALQGIAHVRAIVRVNGAHPPIEPRGREFAGLIAGQRADGADPYDLPSVVHVFVDDTTGLLDAGVEGVGGVFARNLQCMLIRYVAHVAVKELLWRGPVRIALQINHPAALVNEA